jgi:hypothetical protein
VHFVKSNPAGERPATRRVQAGDMSGQVAAYALLSPSIYRPPMSPTSPFSFGLPLARASQAARVHRVAVGWWRAPTSISGRFFPRSAGGGQNCG